MAVMTLRCRTWLSSQRQGERAVVVHGGGKTITEWMARQGMRPKFVRGLRITDAPSLEIAVAVLTGLINKNLVASILALGGKAIGISGVDGEMLRATLKDRELGLVGEIVEVNPEPVKTLLRSGYIPVIAPVAVRSTAAPDAASLLLNVNADTAAGEIAAALNADRLMFLTDVEGVLDSSHRLLRRLTERQARGLMRSSVVAGGMVPKLDACLTALKTVSMTQIIDGRRPHALLDTLSGGFRGPVSGSKGTVWLRTSDRTRIRQ